MHLEIITPEKITYQGEVDEITVNTADGEISILPHHLNLFTKVMPGELILKIGGKEQFLAITGGFLEVSKNKVTILADYAIRAEDIDIEEAHEAQKRAEEVLKRKKDLINEEDLIRAEGELRRSLLELHLASRHHRKTPN